MIERVRQEDAQDLVTRSGAQCEHEEDRIPVERLPPAREDGLDREGLLDQVPGGEGDRQRDGEGKRRCPQGDAEVVDEVVGDERPDDADPKKTVTSGTLFSSLAALFGFACTKVSSRVSRAETRAVPSVISSRSRLFVGSHPDGRRVSHTLGLGQSTVNLRPALWKISGSNSVELPLSLRPGR